MPQNSHVPDFGAPVVAEGALGLALSAASFAVQSGITAPLPFNDLAYMQVELNGDSAADRTWMVGSRFRSLEDPSGVVATSFAAPGYGAVTFFQQHLDSAEVFRALEIDAVVIAFGIEDAAAGFSPELFRSIKLEVISVLRDWAGLDLPIILLSDPYRTGLTPEQEAAFDRYAGVDHQIAMQELGVLAINSRRALHDLGWGPGGTPQTFAPDGVHYSALGARTKARVEAALLQAFAIDLCYADCTAMHGGDAGLSVADFICFQTQFVVGSPFADCTRVTGQGGPGLDVQDFLCFQTRFMLGCP